MKSLVVFVKKPLVLYNSSDMAKQSKAECPACGAKVEIPSDAELNEILSCAECEVKMEIVKMGEKAELEEVKVEEDWGE